MRILISPAKKMNETDALAWRELPELLEQAEILREYLQSLTLEQAQELWKCAEALARLNYERVSRMNLRARLTPAILAYEGIQYQYMAPQVMEESALEYLQEHLRILSGFYGVLRPFDGITPYRLEMQAKARVQGEKDLYSFWKDRIYRTITKESRLLLNLASKEYAKCVEPYLTGEDILVTCVFGELAGGRVVQKGTMAKMARGEMVRYLAECRADSLDDVRRFDRLQYRFSEEHSSDSELVFLKKSKE